MGEGGNFQKPPSKVELLQDEKRIGKPEHLNKNCWLAATLNYSPAKRCRYCALRFHNCLFFQYLVISLIFVFFFLTLSFLIEREISRLTVVFVFALIIIYGNFFNKSTEKIVKANFTQERTNEELKELTETLEERVEERTKELREAYEKLKKLDQVKSEFVSIASHQLRTPLTAIKGYLSMITDGTYGKVPLKIRGKMKNVIESNERLIRLVNEMLSLSRIETGKMKLELEKINLEKIIEQVVSDFGIVAKNNNLYLKLLKPKDKLPEMMVDEWKIRQVLINVIDNALKYTRKGGVRVAILKEGRNVKIKIRDTGEGMEDYELEKVFESFSRGRAGNRLASEGTGLGLYIARKFVEMHDGKIWAESEGNSKGSCFHILIPMKEF